MSGTRRVRARWVAAIALPAALVGSALVASSASAGPGDVIQNPGSATLTANGGGFLNLAGKAFSLPSTATPVACNNGVNDDVAVDDPTKQQDTNIDFDGGASHGVVPATPVDAQCNAGVPAATNPASADDSEVKGGFQARDYIKLSGSIDKDGNISIPQAGITFPKLYVYAAAAAGVIDVIPAPTSAATGTLNPATGKSNLHVNWQLEVVQSFFKIDCASQISMDTSSDPADPANSGTIPVAPVAYNTTTGAVTVSSNTFAVGAMTPVGAVTRTTGATTAASTTFTDSSGPFVAGDVGRAVTIPGAGAGGATLVTTIKTFTNATTVVLTAAAGTTVNPATWTLANSSQALCDTVAGSFGVPATSGLNAIQLSVNSSTVFTPGAAVAVADAGSTGFNTPLVVAAPGVLANDKGTGLAVTGNTTATHGTVSIAGDGSYTYTPTSGYSGADSFGYTITDSLGRTSSATVSLTVGGPSAPVANDDNAGSTPFNTPLVLPAPGVLGNDTGAAITVTANTSPAHGAVTVNADGSFTYTPTTGYAGPDSFGYTITDSAAQTASATVTLTVSQPAAPVANDDAAGSTPFNTPLVAPAPGVLGNDTGTGISVTANTNPAHGSVTVGGDGSYTYTPTAGYSGPDSFGYTITDGFARTASATVSLSVSPAAAVPGIGGTVTDATSSNPLAGITVTLMKANPSWVIQGTTTTDASGTYQFTGVPDGNYQVRFFDGTGAHQRTWYHDKLTYKSGDVLTIASASDVVTADQALAAAPAGRITGRAQTTTAGIPGIQVSLYTATDGFFATTVTGADGYYLFQGVPDGDYYVQFVDGSHHYLSQWYSYKLLFFNANKITISGGNTFPASALLG